jgi:hypothetical protein
MTFIDGNNRGSQHPSASDHRIHTAVYLSTQSDWVDDPPRGKYSIHVYYKDDTLTKGFESFKIHNKAPKSYNEGGLGADNAKALANPIDLSTL